MVWVRGHGQGVGGEKRCTAIQSILRPRLVSRHREPYAGTGQEILSPGDFFTAGYSSPPQMWPKSHKNGGGTFFAKPGARQKVRQTEVHDRLLTQIPPDPSVLT